MPSDDYTAAPSSGKLKLKGVTGSKIEKKKKKKSKDKERSKDKPELAVEKKARDGEDEGKRGSAEDEFEIREEDEDVDAVGITKTPAELRHEEMKRKRVRRLSPGSALPLDFERQRDYLDATY